MIFPTLEQVIYFLLSKTILQCPVPGLLLLSACSGKLLLRLLLLNAHFK